MKAIPEARYLEATEAYEGWCSLCEEFTRDMTEPDAEGYKCPVCQDMTVMGAENALIMGQFTFEEDAPND